MTFIKQVRAIDPFVATVKAGASFRISPDLSEASAPFVLPADRQFIVIGEVAGVDFGAGPLWYVIVSANGGFRVFHSQDIIKKEALGNVSGLKASLAEANLKIKEALEVLN